eukprot:COSAG02_NODE_5032_length_4710_cov_1.603512_6_plen_119_part_00
MLCWVVRHWQKKPKAPRERLLCLDAVRGLNVMLMIFVDNCCDWDQDWIDHSHWDTVHLADFVMPLFLFMVRHRDTLLCIPSRVRWERRKLARRPLTAQLRDCDPCTVTRRWACRWPSR